MSKLQAPATILAARKRGRPLFGGTTWSRPPPAGLLLVACTSANCAALEKVGIERREILVDRVEAARDAQQRAQARFEDAHEQFKALVGSDGSRESRAPSLCCCSPRGRQPRQMKRASEAPRAQRARIT